MTINGMTFHANRGEVLLDAALRSGIDLPHECRAGHCGTCCIRLVSGSVHGGEGSEPGIVHACQSRITGDAVLERDQPAKVRTVEGRLRALRLVSPEVFEVGIETNQALPYRAGQYAKLTFDGFPARPFSMSHALRADSDSDGGLVWFHIRRMKDGRVTQALGRSIRPGHRVTMTGPFGAAYFRPNLAGRFILVATNTGFAPIWSIAVAALRENPYRMMLVIAGGRSLDALYMGAALLQLARFPNVMVIPVCSGQHALSDAVRSGRPTDYLPELLQTDVLWACGAPGLVGSIREIASQVGAVCYADPFVTSAESARATGTSQRAPATRPRRPSSSLARDVLDRSRDQRL
jgi:3-phenylpropionate/trans-cinnamate dioxygenase ferredoxin reductase subunit